MIYLNFWHKILALFGCCSKQKDCQWDEVDLRLADLQIVMKRKNTLDVPHEVSVIVPRAEIRETCSFECPTKETSSCEPAKERHCCTPANGTYCCTKETILNSITIVHSPRHPLAGETANPPSIPPRPGK